MGNSVVAGMIVHNELRRRLEEAKRELERE